MTTPSLLALVGFSILFFLLAGLIESVDASYYYNSFNWLNVLRNFALIWLVVALVGGAISSCAESDWWKEKKRQEAEAVKANTEPRLVTRAGGCETWAFYSADRWHYFTKCPKETTTEGTYTERHGKTTVQKSESITTENQ